jgi:large subunit ribosomal protein L3
MREASMTIGLLGKKIGMTRIFDATGNSIPVTVIEAGPCAVLKKKSKSSKDGYNALQLGFVDIEERKVNKPDMGNFKKCNVSPKRYVRELRMNEEDLERFNAGDQITVDIFKAGDQVDVKGLTKGRGFQGVMKRWGFAGSNETHGTHEYFRHPGSIGSNTSPGRVFKNRKMGGQYGNKPKKIQNLKVIGVEPEQNLILIKGAIPGPNHRLVLIMDAAKKRSVQGN